LHGLCQHWEGRLAEGGITLRDLENHFVDAAVISAAVGEVWIAEGSDLDSSLGQAVYRYMRLGMQLSNLRRDLADQPVPGEDSVTDLREYLERKAS